METWKTRVGRGKRMREREREKYPFKYGVFPLLLSLRSRAVTRGTNNKAKEELLLAMETQLTKCNDSINSILRTFIIKEKLCFSTTSNEDK